MSCFKRQKKCFRPIQPPDHRRWCSHVEVRDVPYMTLRPILLDLKVNITFFEDRAAPSRATSSQKDRIWRLQLKKFWAKYFASRGSFQNRFDLTFPWKKHSEAISREERHYWETDHCIKPRSAEFQQIRQQSCRKQKDPGRWWKGQTWWRRSRREEWKGRNNTEVNAF